MRAPRKRLAVFFRRLRRAFRRSWTATLGRLGAEEATPALRSALTDGSAKVRVATATALGRLGAGSARDDLRARIREDEDPQVVDDDEAERRRDIDMLVDRLADDRRGVDRAARRARQPDRQKARAA